MHRILHITIVICCLCFAATWCACHGNNKTEVQHPANTSRVTHPVKAPATLQDTLMIDSPSAVFYHPDSLQLLKIKAQTDTMVYEGLMHEYFFQMRNARIVIKQNWPSLHIIESKRFRYLLFIKKDGTKEYIDLDTKKEPYGLFVFDCKKTARLVDMSNIETDISFYLK